MSEINTVHELLLSTITAETTKAINEAVATKIAGLEKIINKGASLKVTVNDITNNVHGLRHKSFEKFVTVAAQKIPVLLVGPAGTGKTHAGEQLSEALGLDFYCMSVGAQTSKSDIIGYMSATGNYISTAFRRAYENGGVFLMDEIDAGNANVIIQINAALSNNYCSFPDAMVKRHENFIFIGSANTFGNGASRQYVGRSQLDAATLDRFAFFEWNIDEDLETFIAGDSKNGKRWVFVVQNIREWASDNVERVIVSPRATQKGVSLLEAGLDVEEVAELTILGAFPNDKKELAMEQINSYWSGSW